jgi:hypothetical protein
MLVQLEQVEMALRREHVKLLCPTCRERYELCVAVGVVKVYVPHLFPAFTEGGPPRYVLSFCGIKLEHGMLRMLGKLLLRSVHSKYANRRFLEALVRNYPQLLGSPLTESVLHKAGCDIEAEWALWQLGNQ